MGVASVILGIYYNNIQRLSILLQILFLLVSYSIVTSSLAKRDTDYNLWTVVAVFIILSFSLYVFKVRHNRIRNDRSIRNVAFFPFLSYSILLIYLYCGKIHEYRLNNYMSDIDFNPLPDAFSICIVARNEEYYIKRTLDSIFDNTPWEQIREIIIVDDSSNIPIVATLKGYSYDIERNAETANSQNLALPPIHVIQFPFRIGLTRSRIVAGASSRSKYLVFLDAHCSIETPEWLTHLKKGLDLFPKALMVPYVININNTTWAPPSDAASGGEVMFDWQFEFNFMEHQSDTIPNIETKISAKIAPAFAGGVFAITSDWWNQGQYDTSISHWGGENFDISFRTNLCGEGLRVVPDVLIGHLFEREKEDSSFLVNYVMKNQKRVASAWLDDFYETRFKNLHPMAHGLEIEDISERLALRISLQCQNFKHFLKQFQMEGLATGLLTEHMFVIRHVPSKFCVSVYEDQNSKSSNIFLRPCNFQHNAQKWTWVGFDSNKQPVFKQLSVIQGAHAQETVSKSDSSVENGILYNVHSKKCIAVSTNNQLHLQDCQNALYHNIRLSNYNIWKVPELYHSAGLIQHKTNLQSGNEEIMPQTDNISFCMGAEVDGHDAWLAFKKPKPETNPVLFIQTKHCSNLQDEIKPFFLFEKIRLPFVLN